MARKPKKTEWLKSIEAFFNDQRMIGKAMCNAGQETDNCFFVVASEGENVHTTLCGDAERLCKALATCAIENEDIYDILKAAIELVDGEYDDEPLSFGVGEEIRAN